MFHAPDGRSTAVDVAVTAAGSSAVGADAAADLVGPATEVVDLTGRLLVPGFQDAHVHPVQGGLERLTCDLSPYRRPRPTTSDAIAAYAHAQPRPRRGSPAADGAWRRSRAGCRGARGSTRSYRDRPVFLPNRDHHGAWVNSAGARAGRRRRVDTADPRDGRIERDPDGTPTGVLHEGAMDLVGTAAPDAHARRADRGAARRPRHTCTRSASRRGRTRSSAATPTSPTRRAAYAACADDGRLTAKVVGALWWDRYPRGRADRRAGRAARRGTPATGSGRRR